MPRVYNKKNLLEIKNARNELNAAKKALAKAELRLKKAEQLQNLEGASMRSKAFGKIVK